jgi:PAP2 superfamily
MFTKLRSAFVVLALTCTATIARADVVLTWNELMVKTLIQQGQSPFAQARWAAIVQLAVFEAVNSITGEYEPYVAIPAAPGASLDAAAATAAYRVLKTYFPAAPGIDQAYTDALAAIPAGAAKTDGVAAGEAAAAAMIAKRAGDGSTPVTMSTLGLALPGVWQLTLAPGCAATATGGAFYNWKDVKPFGVPDVAAFRSVPPPSLTSSEFTKDYNEVKRVGDVDSTERSLELSNIARFAQASSPTLIFNSAARQLAVAENRSTSDTARALALLNMATSDSLVASFATKYHYNFWRPENAIRFLGDYGNPKTAPDPTFVPFISTPCFPSYPSNHASGSNGAAEILRRVYGEGEHAITISNPFNPAVAGLTFTYTTFNQMTADIDDARVYGGIHFRFDQVAGNVLGRAVATHVYKHNLRKVHGPN